MLCPWRSRRRGTLLVYPRPSRIRRPGAEKSKINPNPTNKQGEQLKLQPNPMLHCNCSFNICDASFFQKQHEGRMQANKKNAKLKNQLTYCMRIKENSISGASAFDFTIRFRIFTWKLLNGFAFKLFQLKLWNVKIFWFVVFLKSCHCRIDPRIWFGFRFE